MTGSINLRRSNSSSIFCTSLKRRYWSSSSVSICPSGKTLFPSHGYPHMYVIKRLWYPRYRWLSWHYRAFNSNNRSHIHAAISRKTAAWSGIEITFFAIIFVLLFDTTPRSLSRHTPGQGSQSACLQLTGIIGIPPPPGSPGAALIAWSPAKGAVTGRKYHCQLSGIMAIQSCFWIDSESGACRSCLRI